MWNQFKKSRGFFLVREKFFLQPLTEGKGRRPLVNGFYFHFFNLNLSFIIVRSKLRRGSGKDPMWKRVWATFFDPLIYHVYSHMQRRTLSPNFSFSLFQPALLRFPLRQKKPLHVPLPPHLHSFFLASLYSPQFSFTHLCTENQFCLLFSSLLLCSLLYVLSPGCLTLLSALAYTFFAHWHPV